MTTILIVNFDGDGYDVTHHHHHHLFVLYRAAKIVANVMMTMASTILLSKWKNLIK